MGVTVFALVVASSQLVMLGLVIAKSIHDQRKDGVKRKEKA